MATPMPPVQPLPGAVARANAHAEAEGLVDPEPAAAAKLCFLDCETTGLDPERHEVWELAVIAGEEEYHAYLQVDLGAADSDALRVSGYYQRHPLGHRMDDPPPLSDPEGVARQIAHVTAGAHLVGVNPAFDATFIGAFMRRHDVTPAWEYHLVDILPLIAGRFGVRPPWSSSELSHRLGIAPPEGDRHTALGDARWARAMYEAVFTP